MFGFFFFFLLHSSLSVRIRRILFTVGIAISCFNIFCWHQLKSDLFDVFSDLTSLTVGFIIFFFFFQRNITLEVVTKAYTGFSAHRGFCVDLPT